jgi:hypothetical protein
MMSEPPRLSLTTKRAYTIPLSGIVAAGPGIGQTLTAGPISFRYRIKGAEVIFRDDTASLLWIYLLTSRDTTTSPGGPPADTNLLAPFGPTAYLLGEGLIKRIDLDYSPDADQKYIKVHALNGCAYGQTINVTVDIEEA